ncbi:hypothetical protein [Methanoculleus sp. 10]|jgi:DNA-damage-inducible protein D|uniref:hypothetical protein n=1 Tax=Methanoculleus sp. 10 TaxID=430615 RepID=UPI0025D2D8F2|nr:hypothetical protein [Methanoculleus sp. 10]
MKPEVVHRLHRHFEDYVRDAGGVEFWYARDHQVLLGYKEWRNFVKVVEKAKESCQTTKHEISDHFVDVNKMVSLGRLRSQKKKIAGTAGRLTNAETTDDEH